MAHNDNRDILKWKRTIDSIQSNEQPVDEPMAEGTWSVPDTPEQVQKLTTLLKNPLDAETALDELYDVFGDDELFDDLEVMKREEPETDVRHVVIRRLKDMNFIKEVRENAKQVEEAVGEFADPIYDLIDDLGASDNHPVLNDLGRYLDGDTIKDFVADFRRNNDLNHPGEDGDYGEDDKNFESIKEGGVHKLRVDQQTHITAEHHDVVISSNDMGIIVDIYDKEHENIDTNTYWNDDVTSDEEDTSTV
jgi:hypothetical protein